ncbi:peptidyl-tRNA hydrolase, chloroplastic [Gossypium raimondii]|nr:peptidyl-tRNA hydrolase, chloroplastic [Gossypium raimondii]
MTPLTNSAQFDRSSSVTDPRHPEDNSARVPPVFRGGDQNILLFSTQKVCSRFHIPRSHPSFKISAATKRTMTQFRNFSTKISNSSLANTVEDAQVSSPEPRPQSLPRKPWLIVSLGNPVKKFNGTGHNVDFMMVDAIAEAKEISINTVNFKAQIGKGFIGNVPVMLAKPQTFMNSSGESVGAIVSYYKIPLKQVLVIFVHP